MKTQQTLNSCGRRLLLAAALLVGVVSVQALPVPLYGRQATLEAIHQVENPRDLPRPGPCGELGAYQFRRTTWEMHTSRPFHDALDRRVSDEIAVRHYDWLWQELTRRGCEPTTYKIALAWNAGLGAVVKQRIPAQSHRYAERVCNLAEDFERPNARSVGR